MSEIIIKVDGFSLDRDKYYKEFEKELDRVFDEKREKIETLLDLSIETGTLITLAQNQLRGIGKTTMLIERASEMGVPIVVSCKHMYDFVRFLSPDFENYEFIPTVVDAFGKKLPHGFLVDEGVDDEVARVLMDNGNKLLGGFKRF